MLQASFAQHPTPIKRLLLVIGLLVAGSFSAASVAQTSTPPRADATEVFAPQLQGPPPGYQPIPGDHGITALMIAVLNGDSSQVRNLIQAGADIDATDDTGTSALIGAVGYGYADIARQLLDAGANSNIVSKAGDHAIGIAIQYKETELATALLDRGANPNSYINQTRREQHRRLLGVAAVTGQGDVVDALVKNGVDLKADGPIALNNALWKGHEDVAAILVNGGVNVNAAIFDPDQDEYSQTGETFLQTAAQGGLLRSVELLLSRGALIDSADRRGKTALDYALRAQHLSVVELLIAKGASVSAESLLSALSGKNAQLSRLLINSLNLATLSLDQFNSLILAADRAGEEAIVDILLDGRSLVEPDRRAPRLLLARAGTADCEVFIWNIHDHTENVVYSDKGPCPPQFFVDDETNHLFAVSDNLIRVVSLEDHFVIERILLPAKQMKEQTAEMQARHGKMQRREQDGTVVQESMRVGEVGIWASGEVAVATYHPTQADGTVARAYTYSGGAWETAADQYCERSDTCPFEALSGRSLRSRPADWAIWHPNIRQNPYFVSKTNPTVSPTGRVDSAGSVLLEISGQQSEILYSTSDSDYCMGPCTFTKGVTLKLPDQDAMQIAAYTGNNLVVDRYALVWTQPSGQSKLIDLATGESVLGNLQLAGWIR